MDKFKEMFKKMDGVKEIPRVQRYVNRPGLKEIIKMAEKLQRDKSIYKAHVEFGYSLKEIADYINLHYTTVSKVINKMEHKK